MDIVSKLKILFVPPSPSFFLTKRQYLFSSTKYSHQILISEKKRREKKWICYFRKLIVAIFFGNFNIKRSNSFPVVYFYFPHQTFAFQVKHLKIWMPIYIWETLLRKGFLITQFCSIISEILLLLQRKTMTWYQNM